MSRDTALMLSEKWNSEDLGRYARSDLLWDELLSVDYDGEETTYDLTVEETANYVVNDVLTHNSGQLEQDADVILFGVWPHRIDRKRDAHEYQIWVMKNRNRPINENLVECRFEPSRQRFVEERDKAPATAISDGEF